MMQYLIFVIFCSLHIGGALDGVGSGYCKAQWHEDTIPEALLSARGQLLEGHNGEQNVDDVVAAPEYSGGNGEIGG